MKKQISITCLLLNAVLLLNVKQSDFPRLTGLDHDQKPFEVFFSSEQDIPREPLELNYVANMGVLVSSGDFKILIDGLFSKPNSAYRAPSPETVQCMMKGEAPFDGIDLVLATHNHSDHFNPALAVRYLEERPLPLLVAPSDAVEAMRKASGNWPKIAQRVIAINLNVGENVKREVANIPLTIVRTLHCNSESPMNLMYLIEVNGWRVFHEGDALGRPADYRGFGLETSPVDLAVVGYSWPLHPHLPYRRFFQDVLMFDHIALAHVNIKIESIAEGDIDKVRQYYKDIFVLLPGIPVKVFRK